MSSSMSVRKRHNKSIEKKIVRVSKNKEGRIKRQKKMWGRIGGGENEMPVSRVSAIQCCNLHRSCIYKC
jgi:hypothetical protein